MSSSASVASLLLENARLRSKLAEVQAALSNTTSSSSSQDNRARRPAGEAADEEQGGARSERIQRNRSLVCPPASPTSPLSASLPLPATSQSPLPPPPLPPSSQCGLTSASILRYSRHLLLSELGNHPVAFVQSVQLSSVLVVGAGGLGCPALLYLAAAGVGRLGVVDGDVVDPSNLPRQVLFDDRHVGRSKAEAACARVRHISPHCRVECFPQRLVPSNAEQICRGYDVLLDCSDNVATRYLCNDVCVLLGIPCVSASALRLEGQLSVYGGGRADGGPCYRCLFPLPVASHLVTNCNEGGILNAVTGVMGTLQAMEALKCIALRRQAADEQRDMTADLPASAASTAPYVAYTPTTPYRCPALSTLSGRLLLFDGCSATFRSVKLRGRSAQCTVCGDSEWRRISLHSLRQQQYETLCSADSTASFDDHATQADEAAASQPALLSVPSISVQALASQLQQPEQRPAFVLLDVRPSLQFDIAHLPHSINIPRDQLSQRWNEVDRAIQQVASAHRTAALTSTAAEEGQDAEAPQRCTLFVVCRRGVDSLHAARWIGEQHSQQQVQLQHSLGGELAARAPPVPVDVLNVEGGLMAWSEQVDAHFPFY